MPLRRPRQREGGGRLLYIQMRIHGVDVEAMVDTDTSHMFVSERMVRRLELRTSPSTNCVKIVNIAEQENARCGLRHVDGARRVAGLAPHRPRDVVIEASQGVHHPTFGGCSSAP